MSLSSVSTGPAFTIYCGKRLQLQNLKRFFLSLTLLILFTEKFNHFVSFSIFIIRVYFLYHVYIYIESNPVPLLSSVHTPPPGAVPGRGQPPSSGRCTPYSGASGRRSAAAGSLTGARPGMWGGVRSVGAWGWGSVNVGFDPRCGGIPRGRNNLDVCIYPKPIHCPPDCTSDVRVCIQFWHED